MTITYVATSELERRLAHKEMGHALYFHGVWTNAKGLKFRFVSEVNP